MFLKIVIAMLVVVIAAGFKANIKNSFKRNITMSVEQIKVIPQASEEVISKLRARSWPTWGCGISKFPWTYGESETCLLLSGVVTVTPTDGRAPVTLRKGDLCTFPAGLSCVWDVTEAINKHYMFDL